MITKLMPNNTSYDKTDITVSGEAKAFEDFGEISEEQFKLRQDSLRLLMANFGSTNPAQSIYECAHEWSSKQVTTSGLVNYYKAYYNAKHGNT